MTDDNKIGQQRSDHRRKREAMNDATRLSPDGKWLWTGTEWIPAPPNAAPPAIAGEVSTPDERPWYAMGIGELRRRSVKAQVIFAVVVTVIVVAILVVVATINQDKKSADYRACLDRAEGVSEMAACARYLD